jgi:hypothetical protein
MPLILEPNATYKIVLSTDSDKPESKQPYFSFRYLNGREWLKLARLSDEFETSNKGDNTLQLVFKAIRISLIGWGNMIDIDGQEIPYDPAKLEDILIPSEAAELMQAAVAQLPSFDDKKKSISPLESSTDSSVKDAGAPVNANADRQSKDQ